MKLLLTLLSLENLNMLKVFFIRLRKKLWLPVLWRFGKRRAIRKAQLRTKEMIFEKMEEVQNSLLMAQRNRAAIDEAKYQATLDTLNWILYGSTK